MGRLAPRKLIALITAYYKLLVRMYLPSSALKFPPPTGWPDFTPEIITELLKTKSEDVVYLMRFLPYINEEQKFDGLVEVEYHTRCIDWSVLLRHDDDWTDIKEYIAEREADRTRWMQDGDDEEEEEDDENEDEEEVNEGEDDEKENDDDGGDEDNGDQSDNESNASSSAWTYNDEDPMDYANFLQLAGGHGSGAWDIWLDTHGCSIHRDQVRAAGWQGIKAIEDYYEELERQLNDLEIVPVPALHSGDMGWLEMENAQDQVEIEKYRRIYRECGWPTEDYRKEEAMEKIKAMIQQEEAEEQDRL
ncbi:hypothetical protein DM02DRAFT_677382 [Periconia macrospinosa]|uniref:Uncharacterized protein n=1 Tax=Periconia macrospinosa TaxID=97972 RepID=A0A2V1D3P2_9PLEO|nr:hypothetical protein DM02DRAFT_677382 [Periconia macrospinosa]